MSQPRPTLIGNSASGAPEWVTPVEAAVWFRVSPKLIYRLAETDKTFPAVKVGGLLRIRRERLERWLERQHPAVKPVSIAKATPTQAPIATRTEPHTATTPGLMVATEPVTLIVNTSTRADRTRILAPAGSSVAKTLLADAETSVVGAPVPRQEPVQGG